MKSNKLEKLLWSIALPGFGQILNGKLLKGFLFIVLEFLVNVESRLNDIIIFSFQGNIEQAIVETNYQWLMFYPCLYMFAMWDAYRDAAGEDTHFTAIPFVGGAFIATVGVIYSRAWLGPVWLGIVGMVIGIALGMLIRKQLIRWTCPGRDDP